MAGKRPEELEGIDILALYEHLPITSATRRSIEPFEEVPLEVMLAHLYDLTLAVASGKKKPKAKDLMITRIKKKPKNSSQSKENFKAMHAQAERARQVMRARAEKNRTQTDINSESKSEVTDIPF